MTCRPRPDAPPSLLRVAIAAAAILALVGSAAGGESGPAATQAAGMTVHIDPTTGAFLSEPARQPVPAAPAVEQRPELPVVAGDTPAGGITVELAGRFRQVMTASKRPDGSIAINCSPDGAPARPAP